MPEDPALEFLQLPGRLQPQLVVERRPRRLVSTQRLCLTAAPIERQHQLRVQALAPRVRTHERLELGDKRLVAAAGEVGLDPRLERAQAQLLEPADLRLRERLLTDVPARLAPPPRARVRPPAPGP